MDRADRPGGDRGAEHPVRGNGQRELGADRREIRVEVGQSRDVQPGDAPRQGARRNIERHEVHLGVLGERPVDVEVHRGVATEILVQQDQPADVRRDRVRRCNHH